MTRRYRALVASLTTILFCLASSPASAEVVEQKTFVVAWNGPLTMTCGPDTHPLLPDDDPWTDPFWPLSGEPECAVGDGHNLVREATGQQRTWSGVGAARHEFTASQEGSVAWAGLDDVLFGAGAGYLTVDAGEDEYGDSISSEGCGPQSVVLPYLIRQPWEDAPPTYWWATVLTVGIDEDLTPCFASAGVLHATWGFE